MEADVERGNGVFVLPLDEVVVVMTESTRFDESNDVMALLSDEIERLENELRVIRNDLTKYKAQIENQDKSS